MKRVIMYLVAGAVVVAGVLLAARPLTQRLAEFHSDLVVARSDTGGVMSSATYQRYRDRREAVAAMQEELRSLARAESAFVADSGRPTATLPPSYSFKKGAGNVGPFIRVERDGWSAMITNSRTSMRCTLFAALDTTTGRYRPGEPDCRSESGEAWDSKAAAEYAARPPDRSIPEPAQAPRPQIRPPRDWGPVNNTPPPIPWIAKNECQGEGCAAKGTWAACSTLVAVGEARVDAPPAFRIQPGETFTALTSDVHVEIPGIVMFRRAVNQPIEGEGQYLDTIPFTPADTLYVLNYLGEGALVWWFRGRPDTGWQFWSDDPEDTDPTDAQALVRPARTVTWVQVRNASGKEGWIVRNLRKMATGGYMDEVERCLGTAKR